jgi:LPS sulfotransferase NodH
MVKFILLGHKRSGSTLLLCSLANHGNVYMFGELFNEHVADRQRSYRMGLRKSKAAQRLGLDETKFYRTGDDGERFLERNVFFNRYWEPVAVGFKLFYQQARSTPGARRVWQYLNRHEEVRVVHLVRRNLLESLLSLRVALATDEWARPRGLPLRSPAPRLRLGVEECERYFARVEKQRERARRRFAAHALLEVEYERDLCGRFGEAVREVERFLGVPEGGAAGRPQLEKQGVGELSERINNYEELRRHFRATSYSYLFA